MRKHPQQLIAERKRLLVERLEYYHARTTKLLLALEHGGKRLQLRSINTKL